MRWTRRLAVATGLAVAAAGIAVPLSLSTATASATATTTPAPAASARSDAHPRDRKVRPQLRADLKAAWHAPDGHRVAALQAVLAQATAGKYGAQVQQRAKRLQQRLDAMDPTLRADLQKAIDLPKDQRHAAMKQIRQQLRAGDYGDQAKRQAKMLRRIRHHHLFG